MRQYLIGIDGGGSKTDFLLADMNCNEICRLFDARSNPGDIGIENTCSLLVDGCSALLAKAGVEADAVAAIFAGIAGGSTADYAARMTQAIKKVFPQARVSALHDGINVLYGAFPNKDGVSIICGTGSSCFVKKGRELIRIGGYGSFDMTGNGYEMGRAAFAHALRAEDGRDKKTRLYEILRARFGSDFVPSLGTILSLTKTELASYAPYVLSACESGDEYAAAIVDASISYIAGLIIRAGDYFDGGYEVSLAGGIWNSSCALSLLQTKVPPQAKLEKSSRAPSFGAAERAKQLLTEI